MPGPSNGRTTGRTGGRSAFLAVETLYSMDGTVCPLAEMVEVMEELLPCGNGYVVVDEATKTAAIIDPVLDFDPRAGATATDNADMILEYVRAKGLTVEWVLDTHPHADHFSAAPYLAEKTGGKTAIGTKVVEVQKLWQGYVANNYRPGGTGVTWNQYSQYQTYVNYVMST